MKSLRKNMRNMSRRRSDGGVTSIFSNAAESAEKFQLSTELSTLKVKLNATYSGTLAAVKAQPNIIQNITDYNRKITEIYETFKNKVKSNPEKYKLAGFDYGNYIDELRNASLIKSGVVLTDGKRKRSRSKRRRSRRTRSKRHSAKRKRSHRK